MTASSPGSEGTLPDAAFAVPAPPFRVRDESPVWSGRIIGVAVARVEGPDGGVHERDVLHHPGAVAVLPLHEDGTVTLVHQYRAALDRGLWEIPAGIRDVDGEPADATAGRELAEEVGLAATRVDHLATFHNSPGHSDEAVEIFLATGLSPVPDDRQGIEEEHMEVRRVPLPDATKMIDTGLITDAKTVIALLRVASGGAQTG